MPTGSVIHQYFRNSFLIVRYVFNTSNTNCPHERLGNRKALFLLSTEYYQVCYLTVNKPVALRSVPLLSLLFRYNKKSGGSAQRTTSRTTQVVGKPPLNCNPQIHKFIMAADLLCWHRKVLRKQLVTFQSQ